MLLWRVGIRSDLFAIQDLQPGEPIRKLFFPVHLRERIYNEMFEALEAVFPWLQWREVGECVSREIQVLDVVERLDEFVDDVKIGDVVICEGHAVDGLDLGIARG